MASEQSSAQIKSLIRQRAAVKSQVTRILSWLNDMTDVDYGKLEARRDRLEQLCKLYDEVQCVIEGVDDSSDQTSEREQFEEQYFEAKSIFINRMQSMQASNRVASSIKTVDSSKTFVVKQANTLLPKIEIKPFDGNPIDWHSFHDTFKSLVHDNEELPSVQKFHLLKSSLRGEIATVVASLTASEQNYCVAWDLLQQRCNKPRQIIYAHLRLLFDLPEVQRDTPSNLRALAEKVQMHVNALAMLGESVEHWNTILVYITINKLDRNTKRAWERKLDNEEKPSFKQLIEFINRQARGDDLDTTKANQFDKRAKTKFQGRGQVYLTTGNKLVCACCKEGHEINYCPQFIQLSVQDRWNAARRSKLCLNCLRTNHMVNNCKSIGCRKCNRRHHTLLHFNSEARGAVPDSNKASGSKAGNDTQDNNLATPERVKTALTILFDSEILLGTAQVKIRDRFDEFHICRALLDGGSQAHFISENLVNRLRMVKYEIDLTFSGLSKLNTRARYYVKSRIESRDNTFATEVIFIVLPTITGLLPARPIDRKVLKLPENLTLADPNFDKPGEIDLLLGNTLFYRLLCINQIKLHNEHIILQKTRLGWLVTGEIGNRNNFVRQESVRQGYAVTSSLDKQLERFWEVEELPIKKFLSPEERVCEIHFKETTSRDYSGRYVVRLPFNDKKELLGESKSVALKRFYSLERKLHQNFNLLKEYTKFLEEYRLLGHMSEVSSYDDEGKGFYLPHHAVLKESSATTKIRVVFDASAKGSSGVSLNDTLLVGPTMQESLFSILLRFRLYAYVITADIEKMFRQIRVHSDDISYQRILWRGSRDQPIKTYALNTVTYGTASAPYLAVRCLHQLAQDEGSKFPIAAKILKRDFYMDDLLTGASSVEEVLTLRNDLIALTKAGGFTLRQWTSNNEKLIEDLDTQNHLRSLALDSSEAKKTLGVYWKPSADIIMYTVEPFVERSRSTKRLILSEISKLFDPLGLLGPVIIKAKIIIQQLWKANISWDEPVPQNLYYSWLELKRELPLLNKFATTRKVIINNAVRLEIHGFADASEVAYGACIYVKSTDKCNKTEVILLCAKSRVAPVKVLSLPRLELCAGKLLARLYRETAEALKNVKFDRVTFWSDSTIVLHWLRTSPHLLKTFVANRVNDIQSITEASSWLHVPSSDNPADFISRGQLPSQFINNRLWLKGPEWLLQDEGAWPKTQLEPLEIPEKRSIVTLVINKEVNDLLSRFSSITMLNRVVARLFRILRFIRSKVKITGELTVDEIQKAHLRVLKLLQAETFSTDMKTLKENRTLSKNSKLRNLNPFIDSDGILRVGGRLKYAPLSYSQKHPIVLPHKHHITDLIIRNEHLRHWHAGTQATLNAVRQTYWPIDGKNLTKRIIHKCIRCCKWKPSIPNYIMGDLPINRVTQSRPFQNVGLDYCGPFAVKEKILRNKSRVKVYVAVFVCFAIKAIHLEVVGDLTTEACLGALKRFLSRRGKPHNIYSDNATNFVGASNEILTIQAYFASEDYRNKMQHYCSEQNICWHFIPPRSPHFGGLWEAAVKSFKGHFHKTIGDTLLTYEQFNTLTIEIEAILNSRPLIPLSSDPSDFIALTPGHFLIGDSLSHLPEHDVSDVPTNRLSLWQHISQMKQHFWCRWHKEYLHALHTRHKWHLGDSTVFKEGTLVTIREDNTAPMHWKLGRIVAIHPGRDKVIRVATVRTPFGTYKRSIKRLAPLPIDTHN